MTVHESEYSTYARKKHTTREFIQSSSGWRYLQVGDIVLLAIPEEMELLQQVDSSLNGRVGVITRIENDDVEIQLRPRKRKKDKCNTNSLTQHSHVNEKVFVSRFCLCLELSVLRQRLIEQQSKLYGYGE